MRTKNCECGGFLKHSWDIDGNTTWECTNCCKVLPRRVNKRNLTKPTPAQEKAIERLRKEILEHDGLHMSDKYEYEQFDVKFDDRCGFVYVSTTVRNKLPGTVGYIFGTHRHIRVGRHGHVELLNAKDQKESKGWFWAVCGLVW